MYEYIREFDAKLGALEVIPDDSHHCLARALQVCMEKMHVTF